MGQCTETWGSEHKTYDDLDLHLEELKMFLHMLSLKETRSIETVLTVLIVQAAEVDFWGNRVQIAKSAGGTCSRLPVPTNHKGRHQVDCCPRVVYISAVHTLP
jgi:hypothetical protein